MAQGFAFGTGSAIARSMVDSVMGGGSSSQPAPQQPMQQAPVTPYQSAGVCDMDSKAFYQCLQDNKNNASSCDFYYNALQACQQNNN